MHCTRFLKILISIFCLVNPVISKLDMLIYKAMSASVCVYTRTLKPHPGKWADRAVTFERSPVVVRVISPVSAY